VPSPPDQDLAELQASTSYAFAAGFRVSSPLRLGPAAEPNDEFCRIRQEQVSMGRCLIFLPAKPLELSWWPRPRPAWGRSFILMLHPTTKPQSAKGCLKIRLCGIRGKRRFAGLGTPSEWVRFWVCRLQ